MAASCIALLLAAIPLPAQELSEAEREDMLIELVERARWPWPVQEDVVWMPVRDLGAIRIALGSRMYHVGADCVVNRATEEPVREPFEGMRNGEIVLSSGPKTLSIQVKRSLRFPRREPGRGEHVELAQLGLAPPRKALDIELRGLGRITGPWLAWHFKRFVLVPRFRALSAARTQDPGPGRRWRDGVVKRCELRDAGKKLEAPRRFHTRQLKDLPVLGFLRRDDAGKLQPTELQRSGFDWRAHPREDGIHRTLLAKFRDRLVLPVPPLPPNARYVLRADDTFGRDGLDDHDAIDLGAWVRLHPRSSNFAYWPTGTEIRAPHLDAKPWRRPRPGGRAWIVEVTEGDFCLRVLVAAYHLATEGPPRLAAVETEHPGGSWTSSDPLNRALGRPKGNHVHIELLGIYDTDPRRRELHLRATIQPAFMTLMAPGAGSERRGDAPRSWREARTKPLRLPPLHERACVRESLFAHRLAMAMPWFGGSLPDDGRTVVRGLGFTIHLDGLDGRTPRFRTEPPPGTELPTLARVRALCRELLAPAESWHRNR